MLWESVITTIKQKKYKTIVGQCKCFAVGFAKKQIFLKMGSKPPKRISKWTSKVGSSKTVEDLLNVVQSRFHLKKRWCTLYRPTFFFSNNNGCVMNVREQNIYTKFALSFRNVFSLLNKSFSKKKKFNKIYQKYFFYKYTEWFSHLD